MQNQFLIRNAKLEDINQIMEVEKKGFIPQIQEEQIVFEERIKTCPELFLVFQDETFKIAGYLSAEYLEKIPQSADELKLGHIPQKIEKKEKSIIYISSFSILPEFRGNKNGTKLWNESLEYLENKHNSKVKFVLLVNELWENAIHIYKKSGFKIIKTFPNFFLTTENNFSSGILMER